MVRVTRMLVVIAVAVACGAGCDEKKPPPPGPVVLEPWPDKPSKYDRPGSRGPAPATSGMSGVHAVVLSFRAVDTLEGLKEGELEKVTRFASAEEAARLQAALAKGGALHEDYFGEAGWRAQALQRWDGSRHESRVDGVEAKVSFADLAGGEVAVLEMRQRGETWVFHAVERMSKEAFEAWGHGPG
jgi:hypothetical protein